MEFGERLVLCVSFNNRPRTDLLLKCLTDGTPHQVMDRLTNPPTASLFVVFRVRFFQSSTEQPDRGRPRGHAGRSAYGPPSVH